MNPLLMLAAGFERQRLWGKFSWPIPSPICVLGVKGEAAPVLSWGFGRVHSHLSPPTGLTFQDPALQPSAQTCLEVLESFMQQHILIWDWEGVRAQSSDACHFGEIVRGLQGAGLVAGLRLSCCRQAGAYIYSAPMTWKVPHQMLEGGAGE